MLSRNSVKQLIKIINKDSNNDMTIRYRDQFGKLHKRKITKNNILLEAKSISIRGFIR